MPDRSRVFVHLLPSLIPTGALRGGVAVVVDVLRATTAMVHALASGVEAIVPCLEVEDAKAAAASLPNGTAILAGERQGVPIAGFDFGNSPASFTPEVCRGKTLVMTTTNGTRAILASLDAERVWITAFPNVRATIGPMLLASERGGSIHLVCSGTNGAISLEDSLLAGLMVSMLEESEAVAANDQAQIARRCWLESEIGKDRDRHLSEVLAEGQGGRRVTELGFASDIETAAEIDRFRFAAELRRDPLRIVRI